MIRKLGTFLETRFDRTATDARIEEAIVWNNRKNRLMRRVFDYAARTPPVISWQEVYDLAFLGIRQPAGRWCRFWNQCWKSWNSALPAVPATVLRMHRGSW